MTVHGIGTQKIEAIVFKTLSIKPTHQANTNFWSHPRTQKQASKPYFIKNIYINAERLFDPNNVEWPQRVFRVADKNGSRLYEAYCQKRKEIGYMKAWKNATADSALKLEWKQRALALKEEQDDQINRGYLVVLRRG
ncbi:hypothetical protein L3Y34_019391 [Caenorhabditis briggsae]|uniref:Uncharacterized protein n=1 Tax=Caenorhabditis briggsae TaxID=6238 RepID=A0AAE9DMQ5_CAEBR|nr:hypothetical protein L3Y34_019391 [Caenorhabditis briggsae]